MFNAPRIQKSFRWSELPRTEQEPRKVECPRCGLEYTARGVSHGLCLPCVAIEDGRYGGMPADYVRKAREVAAIRRRNNASYPDRWNTPGKSMFGSNGRHLTAEYKEKK